MMLRETVFPKFQSYSVGLLGELKRTRIHTKIRHIPNLVIVKILIFETSKKKSKEVTFINLKRITIRYHNTQNKQCFKSCFKLKLIDNYFCYTRAFSL